MAQVFHICGSLRLQTPHPPGCRRRDFLPFLQIAFIHSFTRVMQSHDLKVKRQKRVYSESLPVTAVPRAPAPSAKAASVICVWFISLEIVYAPKRKYIFTIFPCLLHKWKCTRCILSLLFYFGIFPPTQQLILENIPYQCIKQFLGHFYIWMGLHCMNVSVPFLMDIHFVSNFLLFQTIL